MEHQVIEVETRDPNGKGAVRKLRANGKIPGVLYGHKEAPTPLALDPVVLRRKIRDAGMGQNTLLKISGLKRDVLALIKDTQVEPVRRALLHVDLIEVRETDSVVVNVPVEFTGKPVGVTAGGEVMVAMRSIPVRTSPIAIPKIVTLDITYLELGQTMHLSDVKLPAGSAIGGDGKLAIVSVKAPRQEKVETPAADAAAADGAAPAEGAAAGDKAAAPAGGDKAAAPAAKAPAKK
jgi:large subunit ribosomal protein L25